MPKTTEGREGQKAPRILRAYFKLLRSSFPSDEGLISNIPNGNDWRIKVVHNFKSRQFDYRGGNKGLFVLLSRTQAGPSRTDTQEQEEISRNHVQTFISPSVSIVLKTKYLGSAYSSTKKCSMLLTPALTGDRSLWNSTSSTAATTQTGPSTRSSRASPWLT